ncbi:MAG: hypothetical protein EHM62_02035 [Methylococcus sp.]|nr:MAG: hypothetical protein EHM62_02035 [Methylococcus sp.]
MIQTLRSTDLPRLGLTLLDHSIEMVKTGYDGEGTFRTFREGRELLIWQDVRAVTCIATDRLDKHQADYDRLLAGKPVKNAILIPNGRAA